MSFDSKILKERARLTAQKTKVASQADNNIMVVEFLLFPEKYALEAGYVHEVLSLKEITLIPGTPDFIMGVINFRGTIVSVVNLKVLFGLKEKGLTEMNKVLLIRNPVMEFGLIADSIIGSATYPPESVSDPPINLSATGAEFVSGMLSNGVILLNAARMLESKILFVDQ